MIKIKRTECPSILLVGASPVSKGEAETRKNILEGGRVFKVYAGREVRKALKAMSHGKCAYCESRITAIYSGDIEHFRPKGGGYYWLAADWDNLLFACPFCNQTHTHEFKPADVGGLTGIREVREAVQGKRDRFPLLSEEHRLGPAQAGLYFTDPSAYRQAFEAEEKVRLLLRPCTDQEIERYFGYDKEGVIFVASGLSELEQKRAETSIEVYALRRLALVQARETRMLEIRAQIRRMEEAIKDFDEHFDDPEEIRVVYEMRMREEMETLNEFQEADQEYAGMARWVIGEYFRESGIARVE